MRRIVIAVTLLVAASFAQDTLFTENFDAFFRTNNPPIGWRIFHTGGGPMGRGDFDQDSGVAPWTGHPTPYAGIRPEPAMDNTPDSLISPIIDCRGYMNVTLRCSASFTNVGPSPYQAQIRYSIDSGATFPYVARDYYNVVTGTVCESLVLDHAMDMPGVQIAWVFFGNLDNILNWCTDDVIVTGEHHPYTILFYEDFNSDWSTNNPPTGWRIFHTAPGDSGRDDWHREVANAYPWVGHPSPFAAIATSLSPDLAPDSMISPAINCAGFRNITLQCSTLFYYYSDLPYTAQLVYSTDNGATWPAEHVLHDYRFNHETGPIWEYLKLPYAKGKSQVRLALVYDGDISYINWWSLDDILVVGDSSPAYDVACESIVRPTDRVPPGAFQPSAVFRNRGDSTLVNVPVVCSLYRLPNVGLNRWTATIPSLMPDSEALVTFAPSYPLPLGQYFIKFYSNLGTDAARDNDTLYRYFEGSMLQELGYDDDIPSDIRSWPVGHNGWGAKFNADTFPVYIESLKVRLRTPANPSYCGYQLAVYLDDGAGHPGKLYFKTPVRYATPGVSAWNSVFVGGAGSQLVLPNGEFYVFYLQVGEPPECPYVETDAARNPLANYWQYRSGVMTPDSTPGDFMIRAVVNTATVTPAPVDLRTLYVDQPLYDFVQRPFDAPITPKGRIENFGTTTVAPFTVQCDIIGNVGGLYYTNVQTIASLAPGQDTLVTFPDWTPLQAERCTVVISVAADPVPQNDEKRFAVDVLKGAHTGSSPLQYAWIDSDTTSGPTYSWIDTTNFSDVGELGDNNYVIIPFEPGMHFPFYDSTYDNVVVSSNGWVALGHTNPGGDLDTIADTIPKPLVPNRCVYAWWDNLAVGAGFGHGRIYYRWFGFAPDRYMVVVYEDANRRGADTANGISFQLIFHENGTIICQYKDVETGDLEYDNARNSTIGLEDKLGTDGLCYLYSVPPLSGGINGLANRLSPGRAIRFFPERRDAAAIAIIRPRNYEFPGMITPQAVIRNVGTVSDSIRVFMHIGGYNDNVLVTGLAAGEYDTVNFAPWNAVLGNYTAACSVHMVGDVDASNNLVTNTVYTSVWTRKADIPPTWKKRKVKSAALAYASTTEKLYAMKGSGTNDFWVYDNSTDSWDTLAPMPTGPSGKKARNGVHFTFDPNYPTPAGPGRIWAIKGSGRPDFYYYDIANDTWVNRAGMVLTYRDWPYSNRRYKSPRRGAAIEYVAEAGSQGSVYGIPGNATNYFWRYDIASDSWFYPHDSVYAEWQGRPYYQYIPLDIPTGPLRRRCNYGSDLAYLNGVLYVLKASNTVEAYGFSHILNAWTETLDMNSFYGMGYRRAKNGASLVANGDGLYALKGGNTQQFWRYNFVSDSWKRMTDIPRATSGRRIKVKYGSAMASSGPTIFCLKGSNSYELWEYGPGADTMPMLAGPQPEREGVMAEVTGLDLSKPWLTAYPNPTRLGLNISYNITGTAPTRLRVYDATGKVVTSLWDATRSRGQYVTRWSGLAANGRQVPAGIYFIKLESGDTRLTQKLVIQR